MRLLSVRIKDLHSAWRHIHGEPGNQAPMKCISLGKIFGMIHTMLQGDKASLNKESKCFLTRINFF